MIRLQLLPLLCAICLFSACSQYQSESNLAACGDHLQDVADRCNAFKAANPGLGCTASNSGNETFAPYICANQEDKDGCASVAAGQCEYWRYDSQEMCGQLVYRLRQFEGCI